MWHPSWKISPLIWLKIVEKRGDIPSKKVFLERQVSSGMTKEESLARLESFSPLYSKQLRMLSSWILLVLSLVYCLYAGWLDFVATSENLQIKNWFPRSGAILVAISIWSEYEPTRLNSSPTNIPAYSTTALYLKVLSLFKVLGIWCAVTGTVVWAYGDLLIVELASI
ncbi:hypothetical protein JFJ09_12505 [Pseudoalteromonas arctica]|uniref:hypothetical protein n=1 Tax=Pseudoalteromonas arctica TaxID=394751 RepID=UPI001C9C1449|nr:hypothetical protein [Pseudoalteromonas arctica]MBZ2193030.1 hypothetical protein [Pseudoalteromonas arctica]